MKRIQLAILSLCFVSVPVLALPEIQSISYHWPDDTARFYHAKVALSPSEATYTILDATFEGGGELFLPFIDGEMWELEYYRRENGSINPYIPADKAVVLCIRCPWEDGETHMVELSILPGETEEATHLEIEGEAPDQGGWPYPGWAFHRILVLAEDFGIPQMRDPQLQFISEEKTKIGSWEKELRIAKIDPETGGVEEIPSQVLHVNEMVDEPKKEDSYSTCQVAFLADVQANGKTFYGFFYGNPEAAAPEYSSDLTLSEKEGVKWIENDFYKISLHPKSGQIDGFFTKKYAKGEKKGLYNETYPLHYNPDVWPKGRGWSHVSDWDPAPNTTTIAGPVCVVHRRWGPLPWTPEIETEVVYHFFRETPYVLVESTMDLKADIVATALRSEEVVVHPETEIDSVGWKRRNGEIRFKPAELEPGLSRGMLGIVEPDAPFVCLADSEAGFGMAGVRLDLYSGSRGAAPAVVASPVTILADYGWEFRYWSRSLVYPWGDKNPDIPHVLNADTYYGEKSAYCLFPIGEGETGAEKLEYLDNLSEKLTHPLRADKQGTGPW